MNSNLRYKLSISVQLPKLTTEGEIFNYKYHIKNIGNNNFPGAVIAVNILWPSIGSSYFVRNPIDVGKLGPGEIFPSPEFKETPIVAGYTIFVPETNTFKANDGGTVELYLKDERTISKNRPIGGVRARSHEEISQKQAVWIAIISLAIVAGFEIINFLVKLLN